MSLCREFELLMASDDPEDRANVSRHALECAECRAVYDAQRRLSERIEAWDATVEPPPGLEARVRTAVRRRVNAMSKPMEAREETRDAGRPGERRRWMALAAALLLAVGLGMWVGFRPSSGPTEARDLLVVSALAEARRAEREHARAIASLEQAAERRLSRAEDPAVPAAEAALLLSYRDRIASLESTIEEVREYLRDNPGHAGARTVLLAAYRDKTEILREILALGEPT